MKIFDDFTHQYQVSKTLRFRLIPQGKTLEHIEKEGFLEEDFKRAQDYILVKDILDKVHKHFIEDTLSNIKIDWLPLAEAYNRCKKDNSELNKKNLQSIQKKYRVNIIDWFKGKYGDTDFKKSHADIFKSLFKADFLKRIVNGYGNLSKDEIEAVKRFDKFTTYFTGYHETRENVYSSEEISTSIAYRIVHDNFPKFLDACNVYSIAKEVISTDNPDVWDKISMLPNIFTEITTDSIDTISNLEVAKIVYDKVSIDDIFSIEFFNNLLSQTQIDSFNQIIGGIALNDSRKIQGFNEIINLVLQQDETIKKQLANKPHKIAPLFKQILTDKTTLSFEIDTFQNDVEVLQGIQTYKNYIDETNTLEKIDILQDYFKNVDKSKIFLGSKYLTKASHKLFGDWGLIKYSIVDDIKSTIRGKVEKREEKAIKAMKGQDFSIEYIDNLLAEKLENNFTSSFIRVLKDQLELVKEKSSVDLPKSLKKNNEKQAVRELLEAYLELNELLCYFKVNADIDKNLDFYGRLSEISVNLELIITLLNKVRNFVTKKPYSEEKYKLNFRVPTLAAGWDANKEKENCCFLFYKNGLYYLGIGNNNSKPNFDKYTKDISAITNHIQDTDSYQKIIYKQFPGFSKMLPKCTVSLNEVKEHFSHSSDDIILDNKNFIEPLPIRKDIYELNTITFDDKKKFQIDYLRKTGDHDGYHKALTSWITFAIDFLKKYASTAIYDFSTLKAPSEYQKLDDFYNEVDNICYALRFVPIPEKDINTLVDKGSLYLFQIYNKDFSPYATGKPNLHTLYWKALFSDKNLDDTVIKLNGQAELFFRKRSNMDVVEHKLGEKLVNRTYLSEENEKIPIDDDIYLEICAYANGKKPISNLSKEATDLLPKVTIKEVKHEIIKDRRYTFDNFFFHIPLTLNYKAPAAPPTAVINRSVKEHLSISKDVNIIGIDRGERHLLYAVVINPKGEILDKVQLSLNKIDGYDYNAKLQKRENERLNARQNWTTISKIKDLKQGYLSLAVHEITQLMIKYNAIIVLEALNKGFKRVRSGISEKSVYQNFEKMLINKLNYLTFKDSNLTSPGGILNAYQLAGKFESFQRLGTQSGFLFYVPASHTSKIDPLTGFINPFRTKHITNFEKRKEFLSNFTDLKYDKKIDAYVLSCNLDNGFILAANMPKKDWKIKLAGERIRYNKEDRTYYTEDLKLALDNILKTYELEDKSGADILPKIRQWEDKKSDVITKLYNLIISALTLRNSDDKSDYISSPVANSEGIYFDSRDHLEGLPQDADANGAYHIALKGLCIMNRLKEAKDIDKVDMSINLQDWLNYMQTRK